VALWVNFRSLPPKEAIVAVVWTDIVKVYGELEVGLRLSVVFESTAWCLDSFRCDVVGGTLRGWFR